MRLAVSCPVSPEKSGQSGHSLSLLNKTLYEIDSSKLHILSQSQLLSVSVTEIRRQLDQTLSQCLY